MKKRVIAFAGVLALTVATGSLVLGSAPSACACGEVYEGTAAFHWDEMTMIDRLRYRIDGYVPFDETGERR